jgi:hypothetical protein
MPQLNDLSRSLVALDHNSTIIASQSSRIPPSCAREEIPESRGMTCPILNTERGFGGKPPKKSGFRRHLAGSKMPKEGSKMPKEAFFTAISRWRVVSRRALDASGFWQG